MASALLKLLLAHVVSTVSASIAWTMTTGINDCSGGDLKVGNLWSRGYMNSDYSLTHCPLPPPGTAEQKQEHCKKACAERDDCAGFSFFLFPTEACCFRTRTISKPDATEYSAALSDGHSCTSEKLLGTYDDAQSCAPAAARQCKVAQFRFDGKKNHCYCCQQGTVQKKPEAKGFAVYTKSAKKMDGLAMCFEKPITPRSYKETKKVRFCTGTDLTMGDVFQLGYLDGDIDKQHCPRTDSVDGCKKACDGVGDCKGFTYYPEPRKACCFRSMINFKPGDGEGSTSCYEKKSR